MGKTLGVIGGSGLYELEGLTSVEEVRVSTSFGEPSDAVIRGQLGDTTLLFLPRHGRGHRIPPHRINYRANILALKQLGAEQVLSVSAVGSLREDRHPGDLVLVDQFLDRTRQRASTFFDELGVVAHVGFGDPVDHALVQATAAAAKAAGIAVHAGGTYVCMEGPQFSTRAESQLYRQWGVSVIGMTAMPEAKLAREAELPYATLALATDYDCWHESGDVNVDAVVFVLKQNAALAQRAVAELAGALPPPEQSPAFGATKNAILTTRSEIPAAALGRLSWLF